MKIALAVVSIAAIVGCTSVDYVPVAAKIKPHNPPQIVTRPDPGSDVLLLCDRLGFPRGSDGHRLCVLRGVDRLDVQPGLPPVHAEPYTTPIQILPYPAPVYPAPSYPVPVYPYPGVK